MDETRRTQVELTAKPSLPALFARAAVPSRGRPQELPATQLVRRGVRVAVEDLAAYSRVCGFDLSGRLPSPYLHVLTFPLQVALMADRSFPFPLPGLVHVANTTSQHRAVGLDEELTLAVHAEGLRRHPKGAVVDLVGRVDASTGHGVAGTVWTGRSTYLSNGASAPEGGDPAPPPADGDHLVGATPSARWRIAGATGRRYAAVSGDVNPIHLNPLAAKAFGFPRAIAHGMWTYARTLAWLGSSVPAAHTASVKFSRPVLLPSTVDVHEGRSDGGWSVELRPGGRRSGETGRDGNPVRHLRAHVRPH